MKPLILLTILVSNTCSYLIQDDISCLKEINTRISKDVKKQIGDKYNKKKHTIKLILKFYVDSTGKTDSIVIAKSNLITLNINEKKIIKDLNGIRYKCLWNAYYREKFKPDYVTVVFNPNLLN